MIVNIFTQRTEMMRYTRWIRIGVLAIDNDKIESLSDVVDTAVLWLCEAEFSGDMPGDKVRLGIVDDPKSTNTAEVEHIELRQLYKIGHLPER